jgi:tRNA-uridine 2-sulfurtransferase
MPGEGKGEKVLVAMSGGVDSSVAAALLLDAGYDVTGAFLCMSREDAHSRADGRSAVVRPPAVAHTSVKSETNAQASHPARDSEGTPQPGLPRRSPEGTKPGCCSPQDAADARRVGAALGIPFISVPAGEAMRPIVLDFLREYERGRTPNPCVHCNTLVKFGMLLDVADGAGIRFLATGHYARIARHAGRPAIARALAPGKDQSYVLFGLPTERLSRMLLPLGEFESKSAVRREAKRLGLPVHDKPDSQEVCFVPDHDHAAFLRLRAPCAMRGGPIIDSRGAVLGRHEGYGAFTIGQRRGLRVAGGRPLYVTRIDPASATVTLGPREELLAAGLRAREANWHIQAGPGDEFAATVQIRYNHAGAAGRVRITGPGTFEARFDAPVSAVTPGQAAVLYDGTRLIGGGWIESKTD